MADRPTRKFTSTAGNVFVLNDYITGNDNWDIRAVYMQKDKEPGELAREAEKTAFSKVVVSVNDDTENVADKIMELPLSEYNEVAAEVTFIIEAKKK